MTDESSITVNDAAKRPPRRWPFVVGALISAYFALDGLATPDIIAPPGPLLYYMAIVGSILLVSALPACYIARRQADRRWMWLYLGAVTLFIVGMWVVPS